MADAERTFGWASGTGDALVQPHLEYMRKNRWVLEFAGLPRKIAGNEFGKVLRINCSKAARPKVNFEETKVERINGTVFLAGKPSFDAMAVTFYDSLTPSAAIEEAGLVGYPTVSGILESWRELIYQPNMGDAFGSVANYKALAYLHMLEPVALDPSGADAENMNLDPADLSASIAQSWVIQGMFPQAIDYGDLDYASSDVQEVNVTFRYDRAYRIAKQSAIGV